MDLYGRFLGGVLFPAFEAARHRPTVRLVRQLETTQWASADELHALQSTLLRRLIEHAILHTEHYQAAFEAAGLSASDIRTPEDLAKLPLLDKDLARSSVEARMSKASPFATVHKTTSGSTGQPMVIAYNDESQHYRDASRWRGYGWAGYRIGRRALHYWAAGATPPTSRLRRLKLTLDRKLKRDLYVDCTARGDHDLQGAVDKIKRHRPEVLVAYSQAGAALARYVLRGGCREWGDIPILCGAEPLFPHDRLAMEEAFGPSVFETYGAREFMLMGSECEAHDGLHTSMETMIIEVIVRQPDGTTRAAAPGEPGEVVVTDLHNLAMPHIRYVIGDLAIQGDDKPCACGRTLARIGPVEGRVTDTLRDGDGNPVNGLVFNVLMVSLAEFVQEFRVVQHLDDSITLKLLPTSDLANNKLPQDAQSLIATFTARTLPGIPVRLEVVTDLPPSRAGKRRPVIVETDSEPIDVPQTRST